jgi:hypothetical protein
MSDRYQNHRRGIFDRMEHGVSNCCGNAANRLDKEEDLEYRSSGASYNRALARFGK